MGSLWWKRIEEDFFALFVFLVWILSFHSKSCNSFVLGVQASWRSPKMPNKTILFLNNGPQLQLQVSCSFPSTWWPCAFWADIHPNNYNIYWTSKLQLPLDFEWHHRFIYLASGFWQHFVLPYDHVRFKYNFCPRIECATDLKLFACSQWHDGSQWCNPNKSFAVSGQRRHSN